MKPGQAFFGAMRTHGGWYVAKPGLRRTLLASGLPGRTVSGGTTHWWRWAGITSLAVAALAAGIVAFLLRRRPQSAPAPIS
jgi:hypothetical protein